MKPFLIGLIVFAIAALVVVRLLRNWGRPGEARSRLRQPRLMDGLSVPPAGTRYLQIQKISIALDVEDKRALFILLASDGTINRMGTGALENAEHGLYIGRTSTAMFEKVRSFLNDTLLEHMGSYDLKDKQGAQCRLNIGLQFADGTENGFLFLYGADSMGPPTPIADLVKEAIRATDSWYENFKRTAAKAKG